MTRRQIDTDSIDECISVSDSADVLLAERKAKTVVGDMGFADSAIEEIAIVVRELASNIVKHASDGSITVSSRECDGRLGIDVRAEDFGPGIADVEQAIEDGYSTAGGLGYGLGAVHRLMDDVTVGSNGTGEPGVQIVATRWISEPAQNNVQRPIAAGASTRSKPGMEHNGDAFIIQHEKAHTVVGVIDGLGHGQAAHRAAQVANRYVQSHVNQSLSRLFQGIERACRNTRGVVMALARFDFVTEKATFASVGNISIKVFDSPDPINVITRRGVLGANAPRPAIREWEWKPEYTLVMHSDGVKASWSWDEFSHLADSSAAHVARELLGSLSEERDDATVLVVKEASA